MPRYVSLKHCKETVVKALKLQHFTQSDFKELRVRGPEVPLDASGFNAKNVACVVKNENKFSSVTLGLEALGFEVACSQSLEATFTVVAEDPEEWAMIVIRLDQPLDEERLESFVRLFRTMDVRIPILVMAGKGKVPEEAPRSKLYADCVVREPQSLNELSRAMKVAVDANLQWGSRFCNFRHDAVYQRAGRH